MGGLGGDVDAPDQLQLLVAFAQQSYMCEPSPQPVAFVASTTFKYEKLVSPIWDRGNRLEIRER